MFRSKSFCVGLPQRVSSFLSNFIVCKSGNPCLKLSTTGTPENYSPYAQQVTYDDHIVLSCMGKLCQISRVKDSFDKDTLCLMVSSLVMSKFFYCSSVWSNTSSKNVKKLQAVQNFACRIVSNTRKFDHITPAMEELEWLPIKDLLPYHDMIMTYKCIHGMAPHYLTSKFCNCASIHGRKTRNCD